MIGYFVLIEWDGNNDVLFASTNEERALAERDAIIARWNEHGESKNVWVEEHVIEDDVIFDYDWFNFNECDCNDEENE